MTERLEQREYGPFIFALLAIATGVVAGLGAYLFRLLIGLIHNLFFNGSLSPFADANIHTAVSRWGLFVAFAPVIGAAGVVFLVKNFAPEAQGHGVPEVMDAIYYGKGVIRPVVAVVKSLASALSIGSGGSVGREGPIAQIGSAFGSTLGQLLRMNLWQRNVLIAAGAGGGIAATFNTPLGGLLFATEILLHEISVRTMVPVIIATATATYIGQIFFGTWPAFRIPTLESPFFHHDAPQVLVAYIGLGIAMGLVSVVFVKAVYGFEDLFTKRLHNVYVRHLAGMFIVGLMFTVLQRFSGHYYIEGVGYATIQAILSLTRNGIGFLLLLLALKLVATALTLGSGGSGGIFSPSLFIGACFGGAYGIGLDRLFPHIGVDPSAFALAGMAGTVGGATGAALTAIVMIQEMTLDYSVVIPVTITVAFSYGVRKLFCRESIYTMKLARRGHLVPEAHHSTVHNLRRAEEIMDRNFIVVAPDCTVHDLVALLRDAPHTWWIIVSDDAGGIELLSRSEVLEAATDGSGQVRVGTVPSLGFVVVDEDVRFYNIVIRLRLANATAALVTSSETVSAATVTGVIGVAQIAETVSQWADYLPVISANPNPFSGFRRR